MDMYHTFQFTGYMRNMYTDLVREGQPAAEEGWYMAPLYSTCMALFICACASRPCTHSW